MLTVALLAAILAGILAVIFLCFLILSSLRLFMEAITSAFVGQDDKPSPIMSMMLQFSKSVGMEIKTAMMGEASAISRQVTALETEQLSAQNPVAGMLLSSLGKRSANKLFSNPLVQALLSSAINRSGGNGDGKSLAESPRFKF